MPPTTPIDFANPTVLGSQTWYKEYLSEFYYLHQLPRNHQGLDTVHALYSPPPLSARPVVTQGVARAPRITLLSRKTPQTKTPTIPVILSLVIFVLLCCFVLLVSVRFKPKAMSRITCYFRERFRTHPFRKSKIKNNTTSYSASYPGSQEQPWDAWKPRLQRAGEQETGNPDVKFLGQQMNHAPVFLTWKLPSLGSQNSLALWAKYGAPPEARFRGCTEAEEMDITLANDVAMEVCNRAAPGLRSTKKIPQGLEEGRVRGRSGAKGGSTQGSDTSRSTQPISELDIFSIKSIDPSSLTSVTDISYGAESEEFDTSEDTVEDEDVVFEAAQVQIKSVEVKRGVLVDWGVQRAPCIPDADITLVESSSFLSVTTVPSVVVTSPALAATGASLSSISVDLTDFPLPPLILNCVNSEALFQEMSEFLCYTN